MTTPEGSARVLPQVAPGRDTFDALVIRTDFGDDESWQAVLGELRLPWGPDGEFPARVCVVDEPAWSGAAADEVLAAVDDDDYLSVVFLADRHTTESPVRALLALSTIWEDESGLDPVYYQELLDAPEPREFRTVPGQVHAVQVNVTLGTMGFGEFAAAASTEPDQVLRPF
ncbi:DUF6924 domain-containing protein [Streptomyces sp. NPDC093105]|uniref:DUF6924 domain-containing protein n=1 Tax=Streptomyces sp. NPDC093105 TaxID=3366029 RepID=UPI0038175024